MITTGRGRLRIAAVAGTLLVGGSALAGCTSTTNGAKVSCTLTNCTATFDRGADASASVLGMKVKIVKVEGNEVTVDVGGSQIVVPAGGGSQEGGGLTVTVQKVTADQVVLKVGKA